MAVWFRGVMAGGLALFIATSGIAAPDREAKEQELRQLRERIAALISERDRYQTRYDRLRSELADTERNIGRLAQTIRELDRRLKQGERRLGDLKTRAAELEQDIGGQRDLLARQVRAAYTAGRQEYLKILLNQEDPAAVGRVLTYYDFLNRARSDRIRELLDTLRELDQVRSDILTERTEVNANRARRVQEKASLESNRKQRGRLLSELKQELDTREAQIGRLRHDENELRGLIQALSEVLADIPPDAGDTRPFQNLRGKLSWPVEGPLAVSFGSERAGGSLRWNGVLIRAAAGQEVRAVSHGRVAFAEWLRGYGLLVILDHGDGYMSLYGHNQSLFKETGDWVMAGETIATVGDSGGQTRTALYFEIRHNGRPTDPVGWCRRRG